MAIYPEPVLCVGIGEIGAVLAKAFLYQGSPVFPLTREHRFDEVEGQLDPSLVIVAVGEKALPAMLEQLPAKWHDRVLLLQNELLPADWESQGIKAPTVISIWFEKKPGKGPTVIMSSPVYGPNAERVVSALEGIGIAAHSETSAQAMLEQLVLKNLYILVTNICGLQVGGTVGELAENHPDLLQAVSADVIRLQEALTGQVLDAERLMKGMDQAFGGDLQHQCMGRSAPQRLERALQLAQQHGVQLPALAAVAEKHLA